MTRGSGSSGRAASIESDGDIEARRSTKRANVAVASEKRNPAIQATLSDQCIAEPRLAAFGEDAATAVQRRVASGRQ